MEENKKPRITQERINGFRNTPYSFSTNFSRAFFCNAIVFINSGTSNIFINDIFLLIPNSELEISGNQNEVDLTIYKVDFRGGGTQLLQVWIKEDAGNVKYNKYPKDAFYTKEPNKSGQDKRKNGRGAVKGDRNNKWNAKMKGDF